MTIMKEKNDRKNDMKEKEKQMILFPSMEINNKNKALRKKRELGVS